MAKSAKGWQNKGTNLARLGRYNEAIEYFDKALEIKPSDALTLRNKNLALKKLQSTKSEEKKSRWKRLFR